MDKKEALWVAVAVVAVIALLVVLSLYPRIATTFEDFGSFAHIWLANIALAVVFIVELYKALAEDKKHLVLRVICRSLLWYAVIHGLIYALEMFLMLMDYLKRRWEQFLSEKNTIQLNEKQIP